MNPTLALVRKDLLHARPLLVMWFLVVVVKLGLGWNEFHGAPLPMQELSFIIGTLVTAELALMYFMAGTLVQADGLIGSRAFWLTRPIAPWRLLRAKLAVIFLLGLVLPIVVYAPWWLSFRMDVATLGWTALVLVGRQLLVLLPAVLMGTITDTLGRLIVWSAALAVALVSGPVLWGGLSLLKLTAGTPGEHSRAIVQLGLLALAIVAAITVQYLRRALTVSLAIVVTGLVASGVVGFRWRWVYFPPVSQSLPLAEVQPERGRDIVVKPGRVRLVSTGNGDYKLVEIGLNIDGLPRDLEVAGGRVEQTITWPGGLRYPGLSWLSLPTRNRGVASALHLKPWSDPETIQWFESQHRRIPRGFYPEDGERVPLTLQFPARMAAQFPLQKPRYEMKTDLLLWQPNLLFDFPLGTGTRQRNRGIGVRFIRVDEMETAPGKPKQPVAIAVIVAPELGWMRYRRSGSEAAIPQAFFVHRASGYIERCFDWSARPGVVIGGVGFATVSERISLPYVRRGDQWVPLDREYRQHLSLAVLTTRPVAVVHRTMVIDPFVPDMTPSPGADSEP